MNERRTEHRLAPSFYRLLEALPVGAYACDHEGLITYFNQKAVELWGRTPTLGDPANRWSGALRLFAGDGTPLSREDSWMAIAVRTGEAQEGVESLIERPDHTRILTLQHASPIRDDDGGITGGINILVDVSDRARADETASRLAAIVESSDDAIISKTLNGIIVSWNGGAERIFGYTAEEAVGKSITLIIPPELHGQEQEILSKLRRGERVEHYQTIRVAKDGRRLDISLTSSPVRDTTGRVIGASKVARDISREKREERALRDLHEQLRAADVAKNNFLATLSHELRNPLAPIRNTMETLQRLASPSPELRAAFGVIGRQVGQLTRLIDDLMDVSRITSDKLQLRRERLDLADVLHAAVEGSQPLLMEKGHHFSVALPPEPLLLEADLTRLAQVVSNLLNNAAKYTPRGGQIRLAACRRGTQAEIAVQDNGIGIAAEQQEHLFQRFAQLDHTREQSEGGLGIGLHLAKRLVAMHDGSLTVTSPGLGKGSEFLVRLPLAAPLAVPPHAETREAGSPQPLRTQSILVVDDNRDGADSLGMVLSLAGHRVQIAYDGNRALEMAAEFLPDAILLDIGLPILDGYEVAERIRRQEWGRRIRLIALTGWGQDEAKRQAEAAGFDAHLTKPADPRELMRLLDTPVPHS